MRGIGQWGDGATGQFGAIDGAHAGHRLVRQTRASARWHASSGARGHDFGYAVPSPDDPLTLIPTRHWEAYREGIDDLRYLALLESLIDKAKSKAPAAAKRARAWLGELRSYLPKLTVP